MVRTKRSASLETRTSRLKLDPGKDHTEPLAAGRYLVYRRPINGGSGTWTARFYDPATRRIVRTSLGAADDFVSRDAASVLSYRDATERADVWFAQQAQLAHLRETGETVSTSPRTVGDCLDAYLEDAARNGRPTSTSESYIRSRIRPDLGAIEVGKLTRKKIQDWHQALAESPRRRTGWKTSEEGAWGDEGPDAQQQAARKSTANRVLAILKRALTMAAEHGLYHGAQPWREVRPFRAVTGVRTRFLSAEEQTRLVNACPKDFRRLVVAALHTGSRFGPLSRLKVRDFDPEAGTIWIERDKGHGGDTSRHVVLDHEGIEWFQGVAAGAQPDDYLLRRDAVRRTVRLDGDPCRWMPCDQRPMMAKACAAAGLEELTFHELRHTYASRLLNRGVPLVFVAKQLGHKDTRMVEKHYGHLCRTALADAIRQVAQPLDKPKVAPLKTKKA